jgi:hypothetical protein
MFNEGDDPVDYPFELVQEVTEEEQKQVKAGGNDGIPKAGTPKPPLVTTDPIDDLSGEQKDVAQADSAESHATGSEGQDDGGVTSEPVEIEGEQKDVDLVSGGTSSAKHPDIGSSQSADVKGQNLTLKGKQETNQPTSGGTGSSRAAESVKVFRPISITMLEQGDGEDEYIAIGESRSIRSESHLVSALKTAAHKAMESMDRPFDRVEIVFRRDPIAESHRKKAERTLLASLHMLDEGKGGATKVKEAAAAAAKLGIHTKRYESYTEDKYARKILTEAQARFMNAQAGRNVKLDWPPKDLSKLVGKSVIIETVTNDRWAGTLGRKNDRLYTIKMTTGTKVFGMNDVRRIMQKTGSK